MMGARKEVGEFAAEMERMLQKSKRKGHWGQLPASFLLAKLYEEVAEVADALRHRGMDKESCNKITRECADVGNIAMMIADNFGEPT